MRSVRGFMVDRGCFNELMGIMKVKSISRACLPGGYVVFCGYCLIPIIGNTDCF